MVDKIPQHDRVAAIGNGSHSESVAMNNDMSIAVNVDPIFDNSWKYIPNKLTSWIYHGYIIHVVAFPWKYIPKNAL